MIVGFEGDEESVARRRALACGRCGAAARPTSARAAGRSWEHGRYQGPYLRDTLIGDGRDGRDARDLPTWTRLDELHTAVGAAIRDALAGQAPRPRLLPPLPRLRRRRLPLFHLHLARARHGAELEQWRAVKRAASEAIVAHGGTITHHHAVGRDHAPYMEAEVGRGLEVLRARKERLDPAGIMNPGKLLPYAVGRCGFVPAWRRRWGR